MNVKKTEEIAATFVMILKQVTTVLANMASKC
jgi:hypothetical protein